VGKSGYISYGKALNILETQERMTENELYKKKNQQTKS
jgi:hypothetical protein